MKPLDKKEARDIVASLDKGTIIGKNSTGISDDICSKIVNNPVAFVGDTQNLRDRLWSAADMYQYFRLGLTEESEVNEKFDKVRELFPENSQQADLVIRDIKSAADKRLGVPPGTVLTL